MKNVRIDDQGNLHCHNCGASSFSAKRTLRSKVTLGVGALLTAKKLKCNACGTYNLTGHAEKWPVAPEKPGKFDKLSPEQNAEQLARLRAGMKR